MYSCNSIFLQHVKCLVKATEITPLYGDKYGLKYAMNMNKKLS